MLLLGSAKHVMLTPDALYYAPEGLSNPAARTLLITSNGGPVPRVSRAERLSLFCKWRLWLSWGHAQSDFAGQVRRGAEGGVGEGRVR